MPARWANPRESRAAWMAVKVNPKMGVVGEVGPLGAAAIGPKRGLQVHRRQARVDPMAIQ